MAALAPLRLDVSDLLDRPGVSRTFREHLDVPAVGACPSFEVNADLELQAMLDGLAAHGRLEGTARAACSRCLEPIDVPVGLEVHEVFLAPGDETEQDEAYPIDGAEIDLEPLIREAVTLALPAYPRCRPDCPGLCPECGVSHANESCDCAPTSIDPRLASLANLDLTRKD